MIKVMGLACSFFLTFYAYAEPMTVASEVSMEDRVSEKPIEPKVKGLSKNTLYLEVGGGTALSLNYERLLNKDLFGIRAGFGYTIVPLFPFFIGEFLTGKISFSYLGIGSGSDKFELGAGGNFFYGDGSFLLFFRIRGFGFGIQPFLGYRYHGERFNFRVGLAGDVVYFLSIKSGAFVPNGYISFGYSF